MILEKIISKLKKDPSYKWNSKYSTRDLAVVGFERFRQLCRGFISRFFFREVKGLLFIGQRVKIKHAYKIVAGENLILDDNVYINAISSTGITFGDNVSIGRNSVLMGSHVIAHQGVGIHIGNGTGVNAYAYFGGQGGIYIGKNVIIGPGVKIFSENHNFSRGDVLIKNQGVTRKSVYIEDNCWIGSGVTILAGVTIGQGCVIAAGSVVTKSIPENVIAGGIPAKILKGRSDDIGSHN